MNTENERLRLGRLISRLVSTICLILVILASSCIDSANQVQDAFPPQLVDVKLGIAAKALLGKIAQAGKHSEGVVPQFPNRKRITWIPPRSPYYTSIYFDFTEKDRLYNIGYALRRDLKGNRSDLRNTFMQKLNIRGNPIKLSVIGKKMKVYTDENIDVYFIEMTTLEDKQLYFEIFSRKISTTDRPPRRRPTQPSVKQNKQTKQEPVKAKPSEPKK